MGINKPIGNNKATIIYIIKILYEEYIFMKIFVGIIIYIISLLFINIGLRIRLKSVDFSDKATKIIMIVVSVILTVAILYIFFKP